MANPTSNFGWQMPTSTDLVTDLPADFETFGQAVDTSLADLKGGTTGQILSKASNTDMDFTWITNDVGDITAVTAGTGLSGGGTSGAVTLSIDTATTVDLTTAQTLTNKTLTSPVLTTPSISNIDAKGDLLAGTADNTIGRLAVGTNGQVLTADSAAATGLKWATPAGGGGKVLQVVYVNYSTATTNTSTSFADTGLSATITPTLNTSKILVLINQKAYVARTGINAGLAIQLLRGASAIYTPDTGGNNGLYTRATGATIMEIQAGVGIQYLDSPATTSATTYKTQAKCYQAGETVTTQEGSSISSITLMEIGA